MAKTVSAHDIFTKNCNNNEIILYNQHPKTKKMKKGENVFILVGKWK